MDDKVNQPLEPSETEGEVVPATSDSQGIELSAVDTEFQAVSQRSPMVVGVGASAGGLEALQEFFGACPTDIGTAYVVVQHLSPDFKSMMDQLLSRCTAMPVNVAEDNELVQPNQVYLIPPKKSMIIAEGRLLLSDTAPHASLSLPIDNFFRSLAQDTQNRSIGVVLSGTGSDGVRGLTAISEAGGLVLVQQPSEAKFDGMPNAAIQSGYVDHQLPAAEIPECIAGHVRSYKALAQQGGTQSEEVASQETLLKICGLIQKHVNINLKDYKHTTIGRRIDKRASLSQLNTWEEYYNHLLSNVPEQEALAKEILIGVTRFFRDTELFDVLKNDVIPSIIKRVSEDDEIRVWCTACSTGEEAYSLAIIFDEVMQQTSIHRKIKVFATDTDFNAINEASAGIYSSQIENDVSADRLKRYFERIEGNRYQIDPSIRQRTVFAVQNLISDPPFSNMNLVTCRNLLIYLQPETQRRVLQLLNFALGVEGALVLGPSESITGELDGFYETIESRFKVFRKTKAVRLPLNYHMELTDKQANAERRAPIGSYPLQAKMPKRLSDSLSPIFRKLVENFAPPTLICNYEMEVVFTIGDCSQYTRKLQPGITSLSVNAVLDESILIAVTTAMQKAKRERVAITYSDVALGGEGSEEFIDITVVPIDAGVSQQDHLAVSFVDGRREVVSQALPIPFDERRTMQARLDDLEFELQETQSRLAATVEELETSNEELQSTNEELMAANEELQTTNEELQSVNEELYSVNTEYQHKMQMLETTNSDIENVIQNTQIPLLVLNRNLTIRRFTPSIQEYFNILETDYERSIEHITNKLNGDLVADCEQVLTDGQAIQREFLTQNKRIMLGSISPYLNVSNTLDGVVVSLVDVTESTLLKRERERLGEMAHHLRSDVSRLRNSLHPLKERTTPTSLNVLLVEDDPDDQLLVREQLSAIPSMDISVEWKDSIENALYALGQQRYDVVLLDYYLGDKTALDFVASLGKADSRPPIILMTSNLDVEKRADLLVGGVYDFVPKQRLGSDVLERSIRLSLHDSTIETYLTEVDGE